MQLSGKHILMFEDNVTNIIVQKTVLESEGATVHLFTGGALKDLISLLPIDLIIMDLMIPGDVDGFNFYELIQEDANLSSVPVVAVSAMDPSAAIPKTKAMGFAGFISKPINDRTFAQQLVQITEGKQVWAIEN